MAWVAVVQSTVGLLTGGVIYGCAFGGIFALVFAHAHGRFGQSSPRAPAAAPQIKYSANPPSVGKPDTISLRTALYFGMLVLSMAAATVVIMLVLPPINEVPSEFLGLVLWRFRLATLSIGVVLWATGTAADYQVIIMVGFRME
jgi:hypothetical protein